MWDSGASSAPSIGLSRGWFRDGNQQLSSKEFRQPPELLIPRKQVPIGSQAQ